MEQSSMKSWGVWLIRVSLGLLTAFVFGFYGLSLVFSDLGPGESDLSRNLLTWAVFVGGGFVTGLILGRRIWPIAILSSWGPILMGVFAMMTVGFDRLFSLVLPPLVLSLLGAYASVLTAKTFAARRHAG